VRLAAGQEQAGDESQTEAHHALDNFCDLGDFVGSGTGHFLHDGRVYPPPVGSGHSGPADQSDSRPKNSHLEAEEST